jgi:hypothetical protein
VMGRAERGCCVGLGERWNNSMSMTKVRVSIWPIWSTWTFLAMKQGLKPWELAGHLDHISTTCAAISRSGVLTLTAGEAR